MNKKCELISKFTFEEIDPLLNEPGKAKIIVGEKDYFFRSGRKKHKLIAKQKECDCCALKASYFELRRFDKQEACYIDLVSECGESFTVDHIKPLSKGGEDSFKNIQLLCKACNQLKGHLYIDINELQDLRQTFDELVNAGYSEKKARATAKMAIDPKGAVIKAKGGNVVEILRARLKQISFSLDIKTYKRSGVDYFQFMNNDRCIKTVATFRKAKIFTEGLIIGFELGEKE